MITDLEYVGFVNVVFKINTYTYVYHVDSLFYIGSHFTTQLVSNMPYILYYLAGAQWDSFNKAVFFSDPPMPILPVVLI